MGEALEIELKADTDDAVRELRKARGELDQFGGSADKAGKSAAGFGANLGGYVVAAQAAIRAITALVEGVRAFATELDRQSAVIDNFSGGLEEAQRRTSGLVSQLDLMIASNTAAQAGFRLTERQLANVAVAATQYAEATGDASITTESLARAIAAGEEGPLKKLGISLEGVTGQARKQEEALRQLEEVYGDTSVEADNLGDMFQQAEVFADDLTTSFFEGFAATEELSRAFSDLGDAIRPLATVLGIDLKDGMDIAIRAGAALAAQLAHLVDGISAMVRAIDELSSGRFEGALNEAAASAAAFGQVGLAGALGDAFASGGAGDRAVAARDARLAEGGTTGRTRPPPRGRGRGQREGNVDFTESFGQIARDIGVGTRIQIGGGEEVDLEQNRIDLATERQEREQKALEEINRLLKEQAEIRDVIAQKQADNAAFEQEIADQHRQVTEQALGLAEKGADVLLEAFNASEGPKAAISAALEVARAVSDFASQNYVGGVGHLLSAGLFTAQAVKMGTAGDSGSGAARPVAPTNQVAPAQPTGPSVININSPTSEADIGIIQRRAERAAHDRYDS
jgi:hypothetical protein